MVAVVVLATSAVAAVATVPASGAQPPGAADLSFDVSGALPTFPCPVGCVATFDGSANATGIASATSRASYTAGFEMVNATVQGSAEYTEPGPPFCPAAGSAVGTVTIQGDATGLVHWRSSEVLMGLGAVTAVELQLSYTYQRTGPAAAIVATGGTVTVWFTDLVYGGDQTFTAGVDVGAGAAAFVVNPVAAAALCGSPGALVFRLTGNAALRVS